MNFSNITEAGTIKVRQIEGLFAENPDLIKLLTLVMAMICQFRFIITKVDKEDHSSDDKKAQVDVSED